MPGPSYKKRKRKGRKLGSASKPKRTIDRSSPDTYLQNKGKNAQKKITKQVKKARKQAPRRGVGARRQTYEYQKYRKPKGKSPFEKFIGTAENALKDVAERSPQTAVEATKQVKKDIEKIDIGPVESAAKGIEKIDKRTGGIGYVPVGGVASGVGRLLKGAAKAPKAAAKGVKRTLGKVEDIPKTKAGGRTYTKPKAPQTSADQMFGAKHKPRPLYKRAGTPHRLTKKADVAAQRRAAARKAGGPGVPKTRAGGFVKAHKPSKAGVYNYATKRATGISAAGGLTAAGAIGAPHLGGTAKTYLEANVGKTGKTTLAGAPGLIGALAADIAQVATGHPGPVVKEWYDYVQRQIQIGKATNEKVQVGEDANGQPVMMDSVELAENAQGYLPLMLSALNAGAVAKHTAGWRGGLATPVGERMSPRAQKKLTTARDIQAITEEHKAARRLENASPGVINEMQERQLAANAAGQATHQAESLLKSTVNAGTKGMGYARRGGFRRLIGSRKKVAKVDTPKGKVTVRESDLAATQQSYQLPVNEGPAAVRAKAEEFAGALETLHRDLNAPDAIKPSIDEIAAMRAIAQNPEALIRNIDPIRAVYDVTMEGSQPLRREMQGGPMEGQSLQDEVAGHTRLANVSGVAHRSARLMQELRSHIRDWETIPFEKAKPKVKAIVKARRQQAKTLQHKANGVMRSRITKARSDIRHRRTEDRLQARSRKRAAIAESNTKWRGRREETLKAAGASGTAEALATTKLARRDRRVLASFKSKRGGYKKNTPPAVRRFLQAQKGFRIAQQRRKAAQGKYGNVARNQRQPDVELAPGAQHKRGAEEDVLRAAEELNAAERALAEAGEREASKKAAGVPHDERLASLGRGRMTQVLKQEARLAEARRNESAALEELKRVREREADSFLPDDARKTPKAERDLEAAEKRREDALAEVQERKADAEYIESVIKRVEIAEGLDAAALRIERGEARAATGEGLLDPVSLRADAIALRRQHDAAHKALNLEFLGEMEQVLSAGKHDRPPIYVNLRDTTKGTIEATNQASTRLPKKEHETTGIKNAQGVGLASGVGYLEGLMNQFQTIAAAKALRHLSDRITHKRADGTPSVFPTEDAFREARLTDDSLLGYVPVKVREVSNAWTQHDWAAGLGNIDSPFHKAIQEARLQPGEGYLAMRRAAWDEWRKQISGAELNLRRLRHVTRYVSMGLLALSPNWFLKQLVASPTALAFGHTNINLRTWWKAMDEVTREYQNLPAAEKSIADAMHGGAQGQVFEPMNRAGHISTNPDAMSGISRVWATTKSHPGRRILSYFHTGGPAIHGNIGFEGFIRRLASSMDSQRLAVEAGNPRMYAYARSLSEVTGSMESKMATMKDMSYAERLRYIDSNSHLWVEHQRRLDDTLGNWSALTMVEKQGAVALIFLPFLRFSLRWTMYAAPKNHPVRFSAAAVAASINAWELKEDVGGEDLGGLWNYANIRGIGLGSDFPFVKVGPEVETNMAGWLPASNSVLEAAGGDRGLLQTALAPFSPAFSIPISALAHQDPFTGEPLPQQSAAGIILDGIKNLTAPSRAYFQAQGQMNDIKAFYEATEGRPWPEDGGKVNLGPLGEIDPGRFMNELIPGISNTAGKQAARREMSLLLKQIKTSDEGGDRPSEAEIDALKDKWLEEAKTNGRESARAKFGPDIKALRQRWDEAEKAQKKVNAIAEAFGQKSGRTAGGLLARRKWGEFRRRVMKEITIPTPRTSSDRRKALNRNRQDSHSAAGTTQGTPFSTDEGTPFNLGEEKGVKFGTGGGTPFSLGR